MVALNANKKESELTMSRTQPTEIKRMNQKSKAVLSYILIAVLLAGGGAFAVLFGASQAKEGIANRQEHLSEMGALLTEEFPEYALSEKMIEDLSCYTVRSGKGGRSSVCYEPVEAGVPPKSYGEAEVMKKATGELVLVRLAATTEGPVLLVPEPK